ncbi:MAG: HAD family phosphatase [Ferruginibacter sp.]
MAKPKNIIFDFGGVLLNLDIPLTIEAFRQLGIPDFDKHFTQYTADPVIEDLETGKISNADFLDRLVTLGGGAFSTGQATTAWNAMMLGYRKTSLDFLKTLAGGGYRLFLLSNTNDIHHRVFTKAIFEQTGYKTLDEFFEKAYYSHKIGLRKPYADVFEFVLNDAGLLAAETLFIDDSYTNTDAAAALGFKTHLLKPGQLIEEIDYLNF